MEQKGSIVFASRFDERGSWPINDLVEPLRALGWRVTVVAASETPRTSNLAVRLLRDFAESRALARSLRAMPADLIVLPSQPPLLPTQTLTALRGRRVVLWVMDLYPDVAEAIGVLPGIGRIIGGRFRKARRKAVSNIALGEPMASLLEEQRARCVRVVPLWAPPGVIPEPASPNRFRLRHNLQKQFLVMYAGHFGPAHPVEGLLAAAHGLVDDPSIRFIVVGGGPRWKELRARAPNNVSFVPTVPRAELSDTLAAANLHVVVQDESTLGMLVPSKIYGALAAGRPIAVLGPVDGEAARLARLSPWGRVFASRDGDSLANWIRQVKQGAPVLPVNHGFLPPRRQDAARLFSAVLEDVLASLPSSL